MAIQPELLIRYDRLGEALRHSPDILASLQRNRPLNFGQQKRLYRICLQHGTIIVPIGSDGLRCQPERARPESRRMRL